MVVGNGDVAPPGWRGLVGLKMCRGMQSGKEIWGWKIQGRDPKKSGNLIAVFGDMGNER